MDHNNPTYETIYISSWIVQHRKNLIQEFGVTLLHIKGEANVVDYSNCNHKIENTTTEKETCKRLCLDLLLIYYSTDCFSLDIYAIVFPLAP